MKNIISMLFVTALMTVAACGQKVAEAKVPAAVTEAFKSKFPDATAVKWEQGNTNEYEAEFKLKGKEASANFDNAGTWLETETELKVSELPAAVQTAISTDFAGFKTEEANSVESTKNGNGFEVEVEKGKETLELLFSADGKLISKTQEKEEDEKEERD